MSTATNMAFYQLDMIAGTSVKTIKGEKLLLQSYTCANCICIGSELPTDCLSDESGWIYLLFGLIASMQLGNKRVESLVIYAYSLILR